MRLIDANKLVEICRKGWRLFGYHDEKLKHWVDEYDINSQPTVKAIPIDFIKAFGEFLLDRRERFVLETLIETWEGKRETNVPYINQMLDNYTK